MEGRILCKYGLSNIHTNRFIYLPLMERSVDAEPVEEEEIPRASGERILLVDDEQIIARHGGRVWVESEFGKGSTFCFTLTPNAEKVAAQN